MKNNARRVASVLVAVLAFAGAWELYKLLGSSTGWPMPVATDDLTMPHVHEIVATIFEPVRRGE